MSGLLNASDSEEENDKSQPSSSFHVNTAFAAHFDETSQRAQDQRKADLIASAPIPERVLRTFTAAITAAAEKTASFNVPPISVVAVVARDHRLNVGAAVAAKLRISEPLAGSSAATDVEKFLAGGPGRAAVAKLMRWARAAAHQSRATERVTAPTLPLPPPRQHRTLESGSSAPLQRSEISSAAILAAKIEAAAVAEAAAAAAYSASHKRGRGAGFGRGLDPATGEPMFHDLHPSWRARRVVRAAQRKLVNIDLRKQNTDS
jgi:hypothetical protein